MQNPFSTTYSRIPEFTYVSTALTRDVLDNFSYDRPSEAVYKITGMRGSGKTVLLASIQKEMKKKVFQKDWLVYSLNPSRDMLKQLGAMLAKEDFIKKSPKSRSFSVSASIMGTGAGIGYSGERDDRFFDIGAELKDMLELVADNNKKLLICIDEVSKTPDMKIFVMEFAGWLISELPVYFICTGLYENILEIGNVRNLTFFRRGKSVETKPLNHIGITAIYEDKLKVSRKQAEEMARITKGYAFAFQLLGSLYFIDGSTCSFDEIISRLKTELFMHSYEKVWEELSAEDRMLASLLIDKPEYKREEVLKLMGEKAGNYSVYRDRLLRRGIISARQGYISLYPPFFGDYIREYGTN